MTSIHKIPVRLEADGKTLCGRCGYYIFISQVVSQYYMYTDIVKFGSNRKAIKQAVAICSRCYNARYPSTKN